MNPYNLSVIMCIYNTPEEYLEKAFSNNKDDFFKFSYIYKKINDKYVLVDFKQA